MFERFTDEARHAVVIAQEQSRILSNDYIGPRHLLLALAADPDTVAGRVLGAQGVTFKRVRAEVEEHHGRGTETPNSDIPFTAEAKAALSRALQVCMDLDDPEINPGHLLIGLLQVEGALTTEVLEGLNLDVAETIERTERLLAEQADTGTSLRQRLTGPVPRSNSAMSDETVPGPRCPLCQAAFPEHLRRTTVTLDTNDGGGEVTLLWCTNCGATLSASGA
ncbi:MAG: ATP-dependent Clp protease ATP-binding subunit ClpA [Glaciecola sp.]|jgi:ATP-dependent Clp protease ATP-binding subunit ClpA